MRRLGALAAASGAAFGIAAPAVPAPVYLAGTIDLRAGYGSNPFLSASPQGGSGLVGGNISIVLTQPTATSTTSLAGRADVEQDFQHYGRSESFGATLSRTQQFSPHLTGNGYVSYDSSVNPYRSGFGYGQLPNLPVSSPQTPDTPGAPATPPVVTTPGADVSSIDPLTLGQRTRTLSAGGGLSWQLSARNDAQVSGYVSHSSYSSGLASSYTSYGGQVSVMHALSARTKIGVGANITHTTSQGQPASTAYEPTLNLIHQLSAIWVFNGQVGVIFQNGGVGSGNSTSLGFRASLCGTYPRSSICFTGSRQAAASGLGGQRIDTQIGVSASHSLTERSRVRFNASFDDSGAKGVGALSKQRYYQVGGGYSRDISRRLAVGASGSYQRREYGGGIGGVGNSRASGYSVTLDLIAHFGRTS